MPLTLQPAVPADLPRLVPAQYASFNTTDRLYNLIYPSPVPATPEVISRTIARQETAWDTPNMTTLKIVDEETVRTCYFFLSQAQTYFIMREWENGKSYG
jgi:hypothetical protein